MGRKKFMPGDPPVMGDINVTPMVDIMLVLLIVFIITAPVMHQAFRLSLPEETAEAITRTPKEVTVFISETGEFAIDDKALDKDGLRAALLAKAAEDPRTVIHLKADENARYAAIADALGAARDAGLTKIFFVTRPEKNEGAQ